MFYLYDRFVFLILQPLFINRKRIVWLKVFGRFCGFQGLVVGRDNIYMYTHPICWWYSMGSALVRELSGEQIT